MTRTPPLCANQPILDFEQMPWEASGRGVIRWEAVMPGLSAEDAHVDASLELHLDVSSNPLIRGTVRRGKISRCWEIPCRGDDALGALEDAMYMAKALAYCMLAEASGPPISIARLAAAISYASDGKKEDAHD